MLSQRWLRVRQDMLSLYQELDEAVQDFAGKSGMSCPPGCGACCLSPHAETTVAEMLPLAEHLFITNQVEETMDRLQQNGNVCVQYAADAQNPERGRCRNYAQRPVLCRLFGYAGSRDKSGHVRYGACRVLQKVEAERVATVDQLVRDEQLAIPRWAAAHERVKAIGGTLGLEILPINEALMRAIEMGRLDLQFAALALEPAAAGIRIHTEELS